MEAIARHERTAMNFAEILSRHERVAVQFSGGKDSLAALFLLRDFWPRLRVYWLNTGDPAPEVVEIVRKVSQLVGGIIVIPGNVKAVIETHGIPSDIVPTSATLHGVVAAGGGTLLQDRLDCCARSLMLPMHERMLRDGITLVIRGQKQADKLKAPVRSGEVHQGIEYLFPLEDWTDEQVMQFLRANDIEPDFYEELQASPDCLTCSAFWSDRRSAWLRKNHPEAHAIYQQRLDIIREAVMPHIAMFNEEIAS